MGRQRMPSTKYVRLSQILESIGCQTTHILLLGKLKDQIIGSWQLFHLAQISPTYT